MSFQDDIKLVRIKIIDRSLFTATIFVCIALIPSLFRYTEIGWQPAMSIHLGATILLVSLFAFRRKLPVNIKSHFFLIIFFLVSVIGIINFRVAGAMFIVFLVILIALMIYGIRTGLIYAFSYLLALAIIGYMHANDYIASNIDYNVYTKSKITWFAQITGYIFSITILIDITYLYYKLFIDTLKESWSKTQELQHKNQEIKIAEERYRSLYSGSADGILLVDNNLNTISCNKCLLSMLGYELEELIGKKYDYGLIQDGTDWDEYFINLSKAGGSPKSVEVDIRHKDGTIIPAEVTPRFITNDHEVFFWGIIRDLRPIKDLERKVFSTMVKAEEKERERYAKELHDGLGPLLSTGLIYINAISDEEDQNKQKDYAQRAYDIIKDATRTVKEISNNLSPVILTDYGIAQAIRSFIEKAYLATTIQFKIIDRFTSRPSNIIEFTIYRTLVELINNSIKYSKAKDISISFYNEDNTYFIAFKDNGEGFDYTKAITLANGFGLLNLENRIRKIGAKYNYDTSPGNGVSVNIEIKEQGK